MIFITVHGTGDGEREPTAGEPPGDVQWWRPDSPFCQELLAAAPEGSMIEPFAWSGANEERDRRAAAERLLKRCKHAEKAGEQLHLIGHSHGGSVICTALRFATAERKKLPAVVAFTSVGTPFLKLRLKWFPWDRYDALGRAALAFLLLGCGLMAFGFADGWTDSWFGEYYVAGGACVFGACILTLYYLGRARRGIHSRRLARRFDQYFSGRWVGVSSAGDEAIGGLSQLAVLRAKLFQRDLLSPFVSTLVQVAFLAFVIGSLTTSLMANDLFMGSVFDPDVVGPFQMFAVANQAVLEVISSFVGDITRGPIEFLGSDWDGLQWAVLAIALLAFYFVTLLLLMKAAEFISEYVIGAPIAALLNGAVRGAIVGIGYGSVKVREDAGGLATSPFLDGPAVEPLPEEIDAKVLTFARDSLAATFLASHHELFRVDPASKEGVSLAQAVMRHVSWSELVHTAYFRVPECRAHLVSRIAGR